MKKVILAMIACAVCICVVLGNAFFAFAEATAETAGSELLFSFEKDVEGWKIPDWSYEQEKYVGEDITTHKGVSSEGESSLKLTVDFPGGMWNGAIAEVTEYFDWTPYSAISCDVYLPEDAPQGLRAKMALTVGSNWKWTEMSRSIRLKPGQWTAVSANLKPGSVDWRRIKPTDEFRADIRKVAVRVESNNPAYKGAIYIDNVVLSK